MLKRAPLLLLTSLLFSKNLIADPYFADPYPPSNYYSEYLQEADCDPCQEERRHVKANIITVAPEYYHLKRNRAGGTSQRGNLGGIRISYDHIKRYKFYWGAQAFWGTGILNGRTASDSKIRSRWTDEMVEGYLGYTFQTKNFPYFSFTPFGGYGYFRETNKFISPSPLHVKFTTTFGYFAYGFLSNTMITPCISVGLNARFRTPWEPRCKVSDDPDFDDLKQLVGEQLQYRIEIPIVYQKKFIFDFVEFGLMPFYEYREYGGRENFPFDFLKTKIKIYGINLQVITRF